MKIKNSGKRITAFLFAFVLLISMLPMSSMAETTEATINPDWKGSLTIVKTNDLEEPLAGVKYTIYKVADIVQSDPDDNGEVAISYTPVTELKNNYFTTEINAQTSASVFKDYLTYLTGSESDESGNDGKIEFTNLPLGIYLVVETSSPDEVVTTNNFLVSIPMSILSEEDGTTTWNYDITAKPKNSVIDTTIVKTITGGAEPNSTDVGDTEDPDGKYSASRGDVINYKIEVVLPSNFNAANIEYDSFAITDTYPNVLDIETDDIVVKLGTATLDIDDDYTVISSIDGDTGVTSFKVSLNFESDVWKTAAGKTLTITYDATFTTAALINTDYQNDVQTDFTFTFTDGKGEETVVTTDEEDDDADVTVEPVEPTVEEPIVVTYSYTLTKVDGEDNNAALEGAKFVIKESGLSGKYLAYDEDDGWTLVDSIDGATKITSLTGTGYVTFNGLAEGSYEIIEVEAPEGYSLLKESIPVSINVNTTGNNEPISQLNVVNSKENSWVLPSTGEFGIYLFTIGGVILIAAAIILSSKNKKKNNA